MSISPWKATTRSIPAQERVALLVHRQLDRRLSRFGVWLMRKTKGSLAARYGVQAIVLTTLGRRSGRSRSVVLQSFPDGESFIVVATNDGGATHPAWFLNLQSNPGADVEIGGQHMRVEAAVLGEDEAAQWWRRIIERAPAYDRYRRATNRIFPIVRLTPGGDAPR